jgi:hypothetical protein
MIPGAFLFEPVAYSHLLPLGPEALDVPVSIEHISDA